MGGIGIVSVPRARPGPARPDLAARLRARLGGDGEVLEARGPDEVEAAVRRLCASGVEVLGVSGGDAAGQRVLTALAGVRGGAPLPRLLLLRGGAMDTVARGQGIAGTPETILRAVLEARRRGQPLKTVERDLLRVEADGGPPQFGFLLGTGAAVTFVEAWRGAALDPSPLSAALIALRAVGSAVRGGPFAEALSRRERVRVESDGEEWPVDGLLALLAGTTPDLGLGLRALERCDEQAGFFHAVGVTAPLLTLALDLPRLRAGLPWRRRHAYDQVARELVLTAERPRFVLDGNVHAAERQLRISTGPGVELVIP
ncbi:MAG TPA: diacylglycerol kinase [Anaeromyxobacter sp.]|nr:diacylglycerol kinase [Anaeromyxobacter sp.]